MTFPDGPTLVISSCLLGRKVRYDGRTKLEPFLASTFGQFVEWVPVCPEVECGLPVPREAMHLEGDPSSPRAIATSTRTDMTPRISKWTRRRLGEFARSDLDGFVLKARSPSCGVRRVPVVGTDGVTRRVGVGIFARACMDRFPLVPVEDEERLRDPAIRENFVERIFCLRRYRDAMRGRRSRGALVAFHSAHELQLTTHSPKLAKQMGALVGSAKGTPASELYPRYEELLLRTLALRATPGKSATVLKRAVARLGKHLSPDEKREVLEAIDSYHSGQAPLIVPVTLLEHHVRRVGEPYLSTQSLLSPHPAETALR